MKKIRLIAFTTLTMVSLFSSPLIALASNSHRTNSDHAVWDADNIVIDKKDRPSDEVIASKGEEYRKAFWQEYEEQIAIFQKHYRLGFIDAIKGISDRKLPKSAVVESGYESGWHDGLTAKKSADEQESKQSSQNEVTNKQQIGVPSFEPNNDDNLANATPQQGANNDSSDVVNKSVQPDFKPEKSKENEKIPPVVMGISQKSFIKKLAPVAQAIGKEYDLYPSVILAQAALESNWGHSELAARHHNLFGVKAIAGTPNVEMPTIECDASGSPHAEKAKFRKYQNNRESLLDYANTLSDPLYNNVHRKKARSWREATAALSGKYATDPHYETKLNAIIKGAHLDRYDKFDDRAKPNYRWGQPSSSVKRVSKHQQRKSSAHDHTNIATIGILGGAGSFSLWGFFKHLLGA